MAAPRPSLLRLPLLATLAVALLAALAGTASLAAAPASAARPLYTGMSGVYDYNLTAYQQVRSSGAGLVRIGVPWGSIGPKERPAQWNPEDPGDPNYNWGHVDGAVKAAVEAGLEPLLTVNSVPTWASGCTSPPGYPEAMCEPKATDLAQFATALARRFGGGFGGFPRVTYYQGLNEPNLSLYFLPQFSGSTLVSPGLYRPLINAFYDAVKAVNPSDLVLAAGLGPIAVPKYTVGPLRFARELLCMKGGKVPKPQPGTCEGGVKFDIFDMHPYTTGSPTHKGGPNDVELGQLGKLHELILAADKAGRIHGAYKRTPLWVTEFSYDTNPPDPGGLKMAIAKRWAAEALYRAWQAGVDHFFWYGLRDEPIEPGVPASSTAQSGLFFRGATVAEDQPKPVFYAFRFPFVAYPTKKGLTYWGRTPTSTGGKVMVQVKTGGGWRTMKKLTVGGNGVFTGLLKTPYGKDEHGAARAVFSGINSVPFSMRPVNDFYQPPFG